MNRVPTAEGKQGKRNKKIPVRELHREFRNFTKTHRILFAEVVNSLILKVKNISIFATKISIFFPECGYVCQVSFVYVIVTKFVNLHKENFRSDRENREFESGI